MKKFSVFTAISIISLAVFATPAHAQGCMATVKQKGLLIGTSPDYPPYESLDKNNQIVGFDIDLVKAIGKNINVKVKVVGQSFDGLIPSLLSKKIDMIAAGMTITEERKKSVRFSLPYIASRNVIVTRKENTNLSKPSALSGKSVAVQIGSVQEKLAQGIKGAKVKSYNLYTDAALAVQTRQAHSMILHDSVAKKFASTYPDLRISGTLNKIRTGFAIRKDCPDLARQVNKAILKLKRDGTIKKLERKWLK